MRKDSVMLTLERFTMLADSYGADLGRWPESLRDQAELLLANSSQAREILSEAGKLDEAMARASLREGAALWNPGDQDAALARLRSSVAAQISSSSTLRNQSSAITLTFLTEIRSVFAPRIGWIGIVGSSGFAVIAGLLIGFAYHSPSPSDGLLAMLQPTPIEILAD
ncbi:MAG: hypothetical protein FWD08_00970 [Alphaproteobacteria bacterium]|nr:hypothetical protein [Alphaproteobacteria bacterium]